MDTYNLGAVQSTTDGPGFNIVGVHGRPLVTFSFDTQEEADAGWRRRRASSQQQAPSTKLVIAKLDRLARNVAFISNLMESKVEFQAVDFPQANRLTIHIMAAIAEHEVMMISDRTRGSLAAAKARG